MKPGHMLCYDLDVEDEYQYRDVFEHSMQGHDGIQDRVIVRTVAFWEDDNIVTKLLMPGCSTDHVFPRCKAGDERNLRVALLKEALYSKYGGPQYEPYRVLDCSMLNDDDKRCYEFYWRELHGLPRDALGIPNVGNTCYLNALLQLINSVPELKGAILSFPEVPARNAPNCSESLTIMFALRDFFISLENGEPEPARLSDVMLHQFDWPNNSCNDINETFHRIMDVIRDSLRLIGCCFDAFHGTLTSTVSCRDCGNVRCNSESSMGLFLELRADLAESLRFYTQPESLEHTRCGKCCRTSMQRRMTVSELPHILLFTMKRFNYNFRTQATEKLCDRFEFPPCLFGKDLTGMSSPEEKVYDLCGVVVHEGSPSSGHYTFLRKVGAISQWIHFDDNIVRMVKEDSIQHTFGDGSPEAPTAYLLVYRERDWWLPFPAQINGAPNIISRRDMEPLGAVVNTNERPRELKGNGITSHDVDSESHDIHSGAQVEEPAARLPSTHVNESGNKEHDISVDDNFIAASTPIKKDEPIRNEEGNGISRSIHFSSHDVHSGAQVEEPAARLPSRHVNESGNKEHDISVDDNFIAASTPIKKDEPIRNEEVGLLVSTR
ncbi:hypothetical protein ONE63_008102 [Megalurothrips usitatus]|uniref:Ubiquitin carboxyl-terminal hydrolase n=1 Tax=Megalurothrips usitatus TaxID=439358 RepID=A0AAV7XTA0_9NEOP|nr:hypothetical protein ONE63_008102 [Megalurothrips usitatus]